MFLHVTAVEYVGRYRLRLKFNDGAQGVVDLEPELYGEVFEPLRDKELFKYLLNNLGRTCLALPKSARHVMAMPLSIERIPLQKGILDRPHHRMVEWG